MTFTKEDLELARKQRWCQDVTALAQLISDVRRERDREIQRRLDKIREYYGAEDFGKADVEYAIDGLLYQLERDE